jgi:hypothetical protein
MQPPSQQPIARGTVIFLMIGAASLLSSCVSRPATTEPLKTVSGQRIVLREGQFKQVYLTGSNLPVMVSTLPGTRPLPTTSEMYTLSPQAFEELVRRGDALSPSRH